MHTIETLKTLCEEGTKAEGENVVSSKLEAVFFGSSPSQVIYSLSVSTAYIISSSFPSFVSVALFSSLSSISIYVTCFSVHVQSFPLFWLISLSSSHSFSLLSFNHIHVPSFLCPCFPPYQLITLYLNATPQHDSCVDWNWRGDWHLFRKRNN